MKTKMLAVAMSLASTCQAALADGIEAIHLVTVRGTTYEVVEVQDRGRDSISPWNALRGKRGEKYVRFKLHGTDLPLRVPVKDLPKGTLREIPDPRPLERKHPFRAFVFKQGPNIVLTFIGFFI